MPIYAIIFIALSVIFDQPYNLLFMAIGVILFFVGDD
jgi:hypothetical protein